MTTQTHDATAFPPHVGRAVAALSGYLEVSAAGGTALRRAAAATARAELLDAHPLAAPENPVVFRDPDTAWRETRGTLQEALASSTDPVDVVHLASAVELLEEVAAPR